MCVCESCGLILTNFQALALYYKTENLELRLKKSRDLDHVHGIFKDFVCVCLMRAILWEFCIEGYIKLYKATNHIT